MIIKVTEEIERSLFEEYTGMEFLSDELTDVVFLIDNNSDQDDFVLIDVTLQGFGRKTRVLKEILNTRDDVISTIKDIEGIDNAEDIKERLLIDKKFRARYANLMVKPVKSYIQMFQKFTDVPINVNTETIINYLSIPKSNSNMGLNEINFRFGVKREDLENVIKEIGEFISCITICVTPYRVADYLTKEELKLINGSRIKLTRNESLPTSKTEVLAINIRGTENPIKAYHTLQVNPKELYYRIGYLLIEEKEIIEEDKNKESVAPNIMEISKFIEPAIQEIQGNINRMVSEDEKGELEEQLNVGEIPVTISEDIINVLEKAIGDMVQELDMEPASKARIEVNGVSSAYSLIELIVSQAENIENIL